MGSARIVRRCKKTKYGEPIITVFEDRQRVAELIERDHKDRMREVQS